MHSRLGFSRWVVPAVVGSVALVAGSLPVGADNLSADGDGLATSTPHITITSCTSGASNAVTVNGAVVISYSGSTHYGNGNVAVSVTSITRLGTIGPDPSGIVLTTNAVPIPAAGDAAWDSNSDSSSAAISTAVPAGLPDGAQYKVNLKSSAPGYKVTGGSTTPQDPYELTASYNVTVSCPPVVTTTTTSTTTTSTTTTSTTTTTTTPVDTTAPVVEAQVSGTLGNNGWYTSDVSVAWSVDDPESPVTSTSGCGAVTIAADTAGTELTCSATSAGGSASEAVTIKRDATNPEIASGVQSPLANTYGWNNTDVEVTWECSDGLSGVVSGTDTHTFADEGESQSAEGTCEDEAGNTASDTYGGVDIDKTDPTIAPGVQSPTANAYGWNNTDVTVTWACTDGLSGVVSDSVDHTLTDEGADQSAEGTCEDEAGNTASDTYGGVDIDKTDPTIAPGVQSPSANTYGWNNTDVTVTWECTDALSGPLAATVDHTFADEGADQSAEGTCEDEAGNTVSDTYGGVDIDKTAPTVTIRAPGTGPYVLGQPVTADYSCADDLSGIESCEGDEADTSTVGTKSYGAEAVDRAGNETYGGHDYSVVYGNCGGTGLRILQPVNDTRNGQPTSIFKQGSTVPVKFRACDYWGASVGTTGVVASFKLVGRSSGTTGVTEDPPAGVSPDTFFRWDAADRQWIFNLGTKAYSRGMTYWFEVRLAGGQVIPFTLALK